MFRSKHTSIDNTFRSTSSNTLTVANFKSIQIHNPYIDTNKNNNNNNNNKHVENIKRHNTYVLSRTNLSADSPIVNCDPLPTLEILPVQTAPINFQHTTSKKSLITAKIPKNKNQKYIYTIPVPPLPTK